MAVNLSWLEKRADTLFQYDARHRMTITNEWDGRPAPRFYLGLSSQGSVCRFRYDVAADIVQQLAVLAARAAIEPDGRKLPLQHKAYLSLLAEPQQPAHYNAGPVYRFPRQLPTVDDPNTNVASITESNGNLLEPYMPDWLPDVPHRSPFQVTLLEGGAVSVCASVRISASLHEAGVETATGYRSRQYAQQAVISWASAVRQQKAEPVYSTSWDNIASQALARSLGLQIVALDYSIF